MAPGVTPERHVGMSATLTTQQTVLTLDGARRISAAAEAEARRNGWNVCIAVVDYHGNLLHFVRMDDTQSASNEVAIGKARTAAMFRRSSKTMADAVTANPGMLNFPLVPVQGGLPLLAGGKVVGGIGVSGVKSQDDEQIARAGAALLE
jgi:glc operon protein GlcG